MRIPEGYVLVPVEPTEKMVRHGDMNYSWSVAKIYKAMAAAAPPVELPAYDEAKERKLFESRWGFTNEEQEIYFIPELNCYGSARVNDAANNKSSAWYWWKACAKSRAGTQS